MIFFLSGAVGFCIKLPAAPCSIAVNGFFTVAGNGGRNQGLQKFREQLNLS
jgi:hypothetical protein